MKPERQSKIIEIIGKNHIETQEELCEMLNNEGYNVTQATVSRDIRDLKLTKVMEGGRQKYVVLKQDERHLKDKYKRVLSEGFESMDKTVSGMAMAVAAALDAMEWHEVVGTIAGDDTIMCAIRSVDDTIAIMDKIRKIVY